eukprot:scaffold10151_cov133-Cylindrotheca_fusiformis.AAC.1
MVKRLISFFNDVSSHLYKSYVINIVDAPEIAESFFVCVAGCGVPRTLDNASNRIRNLSQFESLDGKRFF